MRTVIARIFDYSIDGVIASEDTPFFDFCRELPDDPAMEDRNQALYASADLHVMGRAAYLGGAGYFPTATDHPYADLMNAARKIVFSRTLTSADWANTAIACGAWTPRSTRSSGAATAPSSPRAASASGSR